MYIAHINKSNQEQSCTEHCRGTAKLCSEKLAGAGLKNTAYLSGILHDCGKFTKEFTEYIKRAANGEKVHKGEIIHSFAGVSLMLNEYHDVAVNNKYELLTAEIVACAVGNHHGLFDVVDEDRNSGFEHRLNKQPDYDKRAIESFYSECCDKDTINDLFNKSTNEIKNILEKIIKESSDDREVFYYISLLIRLVTSAVVDADRYDTATFMGKADVNKNIANWNDCTSSLNDYLQKISSTTPIGLARKELSDLCFENSKQQPGIFKLNIPTGGGKTLSGLRFAINHAQLYGKKRIILTSPLLSILDQNSKVVRSAINNDDIVLEHHSNIIKEDFSNEESERYDYLTDTWNSPIMITTLVQLLNTLFLGKMSNIRRFNSLCDSVIVIDEIQTVPTNMLTIFNLTVNFLTNVCGASIVMCSATQPPLEKVEVEHPLRGEIKDIIPQTVIKKLEHIFKRTEIVDKGHLTELEIFEFVTELTKANNSELIVCNKKDEAKSLFDRLKALDAKCFHLSADMCQQHRKDVLQELKRCLNNNEKVICVSTQVIEAGVDISFDTVIRYAAGLDSIIQAAGRCNRNGEKSGLAKVYIVNLKGENLKHLESISISKTATQSLLIDYSENPNDYDCDLSGEKSIYRYYHNLYSDLSREYMDYYIDNQYPSMYELLSQNKSWNRSDKYCITNSLKTAGKSFKVFDDSQVSVIVPYGSAKEMIENLQLKYHQGFDLHDCYADIQKLKPFSVSIPFYKYKNYCTENAITELFDSKVLLLNGLFYDNQMGILSKEREDDLICDTLIW